MEVSRLAPAYVDCAETTGCGADASVAFATGRGIQGREKRSTKDGRESLSGNVGHEMI